MGFKSKVKKTAKKAAPKKVVKTVEKTAKKTTKVVKETAATTKKVANNPVVKTAVTVGAVAVAGPSGAQMVNTGYAVVNAEGGFMGKLTAGINSSGLATQVPSGSDLMSILNTPPELQQYYEEYEDFADKEIGNALSSVHSVTNKANTAVNAVSTISGKKKKGIIETIIDFIF